MKGSLPVGTGAGCDERGALIKTCRMNGTHSNNVTNIADKLSVLWLCKVMYAHHVAASTLCLRGVVK